jgi:hypothetical protein
MEHYTVYGMLPFGFWYPAISYIFTKFRRKTLNSFTIYPENGGSNFRRSVWNYVLDCRMSQPIFLQISQNYTEIMKAICLPYLTLADFCRQLCRRISCHIQSVEDRTQNTLCWDRSASTMYPCSHLLFGL